MLWPLLLRSRDSDNWHAGLSTMRTEVGFRMGLLVLVRQHHPAFAVAFELKQHEGFG
jgi:hypothetical protein